MLQVDALGDGVGGDENADLGAFERAEGLPALALVEPAVDGQDGGVVVSFVGCYLPGEIVHGIDVAGEDHDLGVGGQALAKHAVQQLLQLAVAAGRDLPGFDQYVFQELELGLDVGRPAVELALGALPGLLVGQPLAGVLVEDVGSRHIHGDGALCGFVPGAGQAQSQASAAIAQRAAQRLGRTEGPLVEVHDGPVGKSADEGLAAGRLFEHPPAVGFHGPDGIHFVRGRRDDDLGLVALGEGVAAGIVLEPGLDVVAPSLADVALGH